MTDSTRPAWLLAVAGTALLLVLVLPVVVLSTTWGATGGGMMGGGMMDGGMMTGGTTGVWVLPGLALWVLSVATLLGAGYVLAGPAATGAGVEREADARRADDDVDAALATLRERYARDELTEDEFERRVARLLETEDPRTAREFAREAEQETE